MPGGRKRRNILLLSLGCAFIIIILQYIMQLKGGAIRNTLTEVDLANKGRSFATTKLTRKQTKCTERDGSALQVLNLTSVVESLNSSDDHMVNLKPGGRYTQTECDSRHRVAVIVPYRDRESHLKIFLKYMHPFLQRQKINYGIFVIESTPGVKFNRALLLNIGYVEIKNLYDYNCFIFHDVDLLPESDVTKYTCDQSPLHMASAIDTKKYRLPYRSYFGGVCAFTKDHFEAINGFSNLYFDWGGEDDDIQARVGYSHLRITHLSPEEGRYKMLKHEKAKENPDKSLLFKSMKQRQRHDGLNSLQYHVIKQQSKRLYTWILVSVNETQIMNSESIHKNNLFPKLLNVTGRYTLPKKPGNFSFRRNSINFFRNRNRSNHSIFN